MTTEELENKLKISENTCIHCSTLELAKQVLNIFHKLGLKWCNGIYYTKVTDWDRYKENTVYYPFEGEFSSLNYAHLIDYKIISAKEFIALHTKEKKFNLENYEPKGELTGFPKEIIARMLDCQQEQGNKRDVTVFENLIRARVGNNGVSWNRTKEGYWFWNEVIDKRNFDLFFEKYPKKDNQEFKVEDKVYDILLGKIGIVKKIILNNVSVFPMEVYYEDYGIILYTLEGKYLSFDKYSRLLHYRDDYNYDIIDFNNLPKRQEANRWRAKMTEGTVTSKKRLTDMTKEDFTYAFSTGYAESYIKSRVTTLTSLYDLHILIAKIGDFETYQRLVEMDYDVTFLLDR